MPPSLLTQHSSAAAKRSAQCRNGEKWRLAAGRLSHPRSAKLQTHTATRRFTPWPEDALRSTAERHLADSDVPADLRPAVGEQCMLFHRCVRDLSERYLREARRHFYVTPTSYLELLAAYKALYARRRAAVEAAKLRYENGLEKLLFTEGQVNAMKGELEVLQPQLVAASADTDALLVNVERETAEADKVRV